MAAVQIQTTIALIKPLISSEKSTRECNKVVITSIPRILA